MPDASQPATNQAPRGREKRAYARHPVRLAALCLFHAGGVRQPCEIRDFCPGGMLLAFQRTTVGQTRLPEAGEALQVACLIPLASGEVPIQLEARVVRVDQDSLGVALIDPGRTAIESLARYAETGSKDGRAGIGTASQAPAPANAGAILAACRRRALDAAGALTEDTRASLAQSLKASDGGRAEERGALFQAEDALSRAAAAFDRRFLAGVEAQIDELMQHGARRPAAPEPRSERLALMEADALDAWLAVTEIAHYAESRAQGELGALEARLAQLMARPIERGGNPFGPQVFALPFQDAVAMLQLARPAVDRCHAAFKQVLVRRLEPLYGEINAYLVEQGVMPKLTAAPVREERAGPRRQGRPPQASDKAAAGADARPADRGAAGTRVPPARHAGVEARGVREDTGVRTGTAGAAAPIDRVAEAQVLGSGALGSVLRRLNALARIQDEVRTGNTNAVIAACEAAQRAGDPAGAAAEPQAGDPGHLRWRRRTARLRPGDWLEFIVAGQARQLRLAWVSARGDRYVFVDGRGLRALEMGVDGLTAELRAGTAVLLEGAGEPVAERAQYLLLQQLYEDMLRAGGRDRASSGLGEAGRGDGAVEGAPLHFQRVAAASDTGQTLHCKVLPAVPAGGTAALDRLVIGEAFRFMATHPQALAAAGGFAIEVSAGSLAEPSFGDFVLAQARSSGAPLERVCFGVAAGADIDRLSDAAAFMHELRERGCTFSIDGFGGARTTVAQVKRLPVNHLGIDEALVARMDGDAASRALVCAIAEIGHFIGSKVIARGVKTHATLELLRSAGIDYVQGGVVAGPRPLDALLHP